MAKSPAMKRYTRRLLVLMLAYLGLLFFAVRYFDQPGSHIGDPAAWVLALLPALPIIGVFWAIGRLIVETTDEYVRRQLTRQMLIETGLALSIVTVWTFLGNYALAPKVDGFVVVMLFFLGFGIGGCINALGERRARSRLESAEASPR